MELITEVQHDGFNYKIEVHTHLSASGKKMIYANVYKENPNSIDNKWEFVHKKGVYEDEFSLGYSDFAFLALKEGSEKVLSQTLKSHSEKNFKNEIENLLRTYNAKPEVSLTKYRHYNGDTYFVFGEGLYKETEEVFVLFVDQRGEYFVLPPDIFYGTVQIDGQNIPRFMKID